MPSIYFIDYLGTMKKMDYCAHGYPSYILLSLFDRLWKVWAIGIADVQRDMTREEAVELANRCMDEMKNRFPMNEHHYITKIVSKEGIEVMKCYAVCLHRSYWIYGISASPDMTNTRYKYNSLPVAPIIVLYLLVTVQSRTHIIIINSATDIFHHLLQFYSLNPPPLLPSSFRSDPSDKSTSDHPSFIASSSSIHHHLSPLLPSLNTSEFVVSTGASSFTSSGLDVDSK